MAHAVQKKRGHNFSITKKKIFFWPNLFFLFKKRGRHITNITFIIKTKSTGLTVHSLRLDTGVSVLCTLIDVSTLAELLARLALTLVARLTVSTGLGEQASVLVERMKVPDNPRLGGHTVSGGDTADCSTYKFEGSRITGIPTCVLNWSGRSPDSQNCLETLPLETKSW